MSKDRFSVLLTCNASGDYLMKPLVIYKYKRPRAYKGCDMSTGNKLRKVTCLPRYRDNGLKNVSSRTPKSTARKRTLALKSDFSVM